MKFETLVEDENKLLKRKQLKGIIDFEGGTPSNDDVQKALADKYGVKPQLVVVRHIYTKFGQTRAEFEASVYASVEQLKAIEPPQFHPKEEEKKEEPSEAAEEKAEEKPEKKAEEKPEKKEEAEKPEEKAEEKPEKKEEAKPEEKEGQ